MAETKLYQRCNWCKGEGKHGHFTTANEWVVDEDPCHDCLGTGKIESPAGTILDPELEAKVDALTTNMVTVLAELDYIHGKVTAIWHKVK